MREPFTKEGSGLARSADLGADRRISERFPFSAVAEMVEPISRAKLSVRISDISRQGCYVDSLNVSPVGTLITLSIRHAGSHFESAAKIIYSRPGLGMGLLFAETVTEMDATLQRWLAEAKGDIATVQQTKTPAPPLENELCRQQECLNRLIQLMLRKGLLTPSERSELLEASSGNL